MKGREGVLRDWFPSVHTQAGTGSVSSPCLQRANSPLDSPKGSCLRKEESCEAFSFTSPHEILPFKAGLPFRRCGARSQTTWDKPGVCGRKCTGRRVKDLSIILRLGRNSLRESEYSCFPPVCLWYSSTCSLNAEPKTIGGRAHGPLGMLAVPNSCN